MQHLFRQVPQKQQTFPTLLTLPLGADVDDKTCDGGGGADEISSPADVHEAWFRHKVHVFLIAQ